MPKCAQQPLMRIGYLDVIADLDLSEQLEKGVV